MNCLLVVFQGLSKDEDVVQVDYYDLIYYKVLKYIIHSLKHSGAVSYSKEYYQRLKKFIVSVEDVRVTSRVCGIS